ncbi:LOW QUALITY PROTEIN: hypothetical protein OSB04_019624 [Centaurea solstitialis]|uniref:CCHC-type domain-containing protein n=1 Tax=Centaurea solstitialis TaxID=347529 RepID=A0AA38T453_9ASTR|nr:LOW QUALITY PROTEIN: hypothetical protein OSB04_019624 [Centaurea solstitialis]
MIEREKNRQMNERGGEKRIWDGPVSDLRKGKTPRTEFGSQAMWEMPSGASWELSVGTVTCFQCGMSGHLARDCTSKRSCFQCGSSDHIRPDCPQLKRGGAPITRERTIEAKDDRKTAPAQARGRAFGMIAEEAKEASDVVTGTLLVKFLRAKVLFDTGADYSYATPELLKLLCVKLEPLDHPYEADTANERVREVARGCTIELEGCLVPVALIPIPMGRTGCGVRHGLVDEK